jgi:hypothetical protein
MKTYSGDNVDKQLHDNTVLIYLGNKISPESNYPFWRGACAPVI